MVSVFGLCYFVIWSYMFEFNNQFAGKPEIFHIKNNCAVLNHICTFTLYLALRGDTRSAIETPTERRRVRRSM